MADRLVVRTERRMGLIRVGGWLFLIGLVALIIGALATWLGTLGQAAFANDRVEIPGELTFDGDGGDYTLLLIENPVYATGYGNAVAQIICDVARPDGTTTEVDGSFALVRTETDLGVEIGRFSTTAGETVVDCRWSGTGGDREGYYASVAPAATARATTRPSHRPRPGSPSHPRPCSSAASRCCSSLAHCSTAGIAVDPSPSACPQTTRRARQSSAPPPTPHCARASAVERPHRADAIRTPAPRG